MNLDQLMQDTAEQQRHPFVVRNAEGRKAYRTWCATDAVRWAEFYRDASNGHPFRVTRNGRLLWPKPTPTSTNRGM